MAYISNSTKGLGDTVVLTEAKRSLAGYFQKGSQVKIVDVDPMRGYTFEDEFGNRVSEAGFDGFK